MVKRFLLSYLLFLSVPTLMGAILYLRTIEVLDSQIQQRGIESLKKSGQTLELILQEVGRIATNLETNEPLLELGSRPDILQAPQISQLVDYVVNTPLIPYSLINPYISAYYVAFGKSGTVFVPGMATSLSSFYRYVLRFNGLDLAAWEAEFLNQIYRRSYLPARLVTTNERSFSAIPYVDSVAFRGSRVGVIVIFLDTERLLSLFDEIDISKGGAIFVTDETGSLLASRMVRVPRNVHPDAVLAVARSSAAVRFGKSIVMQTTLRNGWTVTAMQSNAYLQKKASYISVTTLIVVALFLLGGVVVAIALALRESKPLLAVVRELSERLPSKFGSTDVYGLLRSGIVRLISRTNQLKEELEAQRPFTQRLFMDELLGGLLRDDAEVMSLARQVGLSIEGKTHAVLVVRLGTMGQMAKSDSLQEVQLHKLVLKRAVHERWPHILVHDVEQDKVAFVFSSASEDEQQFYDELAKILDNMEARIFDSLSTPLTVAVGGCHHAASNLYRSFRQAIVALNYDVDPTRSPTWYHEVLAEDAVGFWYPPATDQRLMMLARGGYLEDLANLVTEIRARNFQDRSLPFAMQAIVVSLFRATLIRVYRETNFHEPGLDARVEEVTQPSNDDFLSQYDSVASILTELCERLTTVQRDHSRQLKDRMVTYLQENYTNTNLSLTSMADHLGLSVQYLSRLCRDYLGENFHVYLERVRMEAVREKLRAAPSVQLKEVVAEVGYASLNTFAKAFKRRYGINATEYRRRIQTSLEKHGD